MRSDFHEMSARIEALLASRGAAADGPGPSFRWEADAGGTIHWVEGVARAAVIGRTIAAPADAGGDGADPRIAAAFRQRAPFRDAPFAIGDGGGAAGRWRMAGVPVFDPRSGSFAGFRGSAHRERPERDIAPAPAHDPIILADGDRKAQPDSVRQLVHELRTPLNAIVGFAEMIDGQHLGPAGAGYRARAAGIRRQASQLLSAIDDLDLAARAETDGIQPARETDLAALLAEIEERLGRAAGNNGPGLRIEASSDLSPARVDRDIADRLFTCLIGAVAAVSEADEVLPGWLRRDEDRAAIIFCLNRPRRLARYSEVELLDPMLDLAGGGAGATPMGFGFALRLVRRIAEALGGSLDVHASHLILALPACAE